MFKLDFSHFATGTKAKPAPAAKRTATPKKAKTVAAKPKARTTAKAEVSFAHLAPLGEAFAEQVAAEVQAAATESSIDRMVRAMRKARGKSAPQRNSVDRLVAAMKRARGIS